LYGELLELDGWLLDELLLDELDDDPQYGATVTYAVPTTPAQHPDPSPMYTPFGVSSILNSTYPPQSP